eukprot:TRINITY_DN62503_c0_g1_i1.p1 TRINITY_DN62503_c0_g1~~TRINITY_DN62503_c0_g1_i1.p1  ORF type:complete len:235 (-),score=41.04 TRINITY_DN62503_c0_g1_i1:149-853(-)
MSVDSRLGLPQSICGDSLGLPCARLRPRSKKSASALPSVELKIPEEKGSVLPGGNADTDLRYMSFSGTSPLSWRTARSRSAGLLRPGGVIEKVLDLRTETHLDRLVEVLVRAAPDQRRDELRYFKQPFNPHREAAESRFIDKTTRKKQVMQVLKKYPLCDIYDLVRCDELQWSAISRDLGGISFGVAMKYAMEVVGEKFTPLERASFWSAVGNRQRVTDHGRQSFLAAQDYPEY